MPEVVGQHHRAQPQLRGHRGSGGQPGERSQLLPERARGEMVPQQQHVDPSVFDLPCEIEPCPAFPHRLADDPEPQPLHGQARYRKKPRQPPKTKAPQWPRSARKHSAEPMSTGPRIGHAAVEEGGGGDRAAGPAQPR